MPSNILIKCGKTLQEKNLTVVFAESVTAGRLCAEFSLLENAGKFLKGSLVTYDAGLKQDNLNVPRSLIDDYTPESAEVTEAMTMGLRDLVPADIYLSITGLNSEGGSETKTKPVGTIFIHGLYGNIEIKDRSVFKGSPKKIVMQAIERVAFLIHEAITLDEQ
ncbi:CinA family protein [Pedobacter sp.]|uniref:CinA family protein n=1 Tax=Pedobacter sp. TaxID=1411316 RepID=UPI003D7FBC6B